METNADRSKEYVAIEKEIEMECVAVEKDDGSNFAFEYGDMAMLHYRSQDILASTFSQAHEWALVGLGGGH